MPGVIGDYNASEIAHMSREEFDAAEKRGWKKEIEDIQLPSGNFTSVPPSFRPPAEQDGWTPVIPRSGPPPRNDVWASNSKQGKDFTCPSGQTCRVRDVQPEELLTAGILDQVTSLDGLANQLVEKSQGQPPSVKDVKREDLANLLQVINVLVPLAVVEPKVYADDDKAAPEGAIRCSDIDISDRIAIMNQSLSKVVALQSFRNAG